MSVAAVRKHNLFFFFVSNWKTTTLRFQKYLLANRCVPYSKYASRCTAIITYIACSTMAYSNAAQAAEKPTVLKVGNFFGKLKYGINDTSIGDISFVTRSAIGERVFKACGAKDFCHVQARIDINNKTFAKSIIAVEKVPRFVTPADVLAYVYAQYETDTYGRPFEIADEDLGMIYTSSLAKIILTERARGKKDEDEAFDYPFYTSQEGSPKGIKIDTVQAGSRTAVVKVVFHSDEDPEKRPMRTNFEMVNTEAGWRIDEIKLSIQHPTPTDSYRVNLTKVPSR